MVASSDRQLPHTSEYVVDCLDAELPIVGGLDETTASIPDAGQLLLRPEHRHIWPIPGIREFQNLNRPKAG
jgi:hypothetical protein